MKNRLKPLLAFFGLLMIIVIVSLVPELIGGDLTDFLKGKLGDNYHYTIVGAGLLALLVYTYWSEGDGFFNRKTNGTPLENVSQDSLQNIRTSLSESYQQRIDSKLASRFPVNIEVAYSREGSPTKGHLYNKSLRVSDLKKELIEIFDKQRGRLLIIGAPGAGKTTLLLQLAIKLLERGEEQIPFIINIATWRVRFNSIEEWMKELLPQMGFSKTLASQIIREGRLLPLFDGLDELMEEERPSFLDAVAVYGKDNAAKYAICSRVIEYAETKDAAVEGQVMVKPLGLTQIIQGLKETESTETQGLLDAIRKDPLLAEALQTPFYLNTAQLLFSTKQTWEEVKFTGNHLKDREQEIVEKFVISNIENFAQYNYYHVRRWIAYLANTMQRKNIVDVELSKLQYNWCKLTRRQYIAQALVFTLVVGLTAGTFAGIFFGIILGLSEGIIGGVFSDILGGIFNGLLFGLVVTLLGCMVYGLYLGIKKIRGIIETRETIRWSLQLYFDGLKNSLLGNKKFYFGIALLFGFYFSLFDGKEIIVVINSILGGGVAIMITSTALSLINIISNAQSYLKTTHPYQRFYASMWSLHFSIIQHFHLRRILYKKGLLPWRLVDFLNEATKNNILESDGGSWRFRHRILQDYFAEHWEKEYAATEDGMMEEGE
ncbi:hypothetical protein [Lewinella sp. LCG006]|uniref:hypothetical protein n=1 Tax=Lewinella sp. LCG006 TaxID=3231911 RepID=UPI0034602369